MSFIYTMERFQIEVVAALDDSQIRTLLSNLPSNEGTNSSRVLSGRGVVSRFKMPVLGKVVIKNYLRGGLFRRLPLPFYVGAKTYRSKQEFYTLLKLLDLGVSVPSPLAWIGYGRYFKRAWLVMAEIDNEINLADYSSLKSNDLEIYCRKAALEVIKLIEAGIWHIDLHPGNVLINKQEQVFLIDFDKACKFKGSLNKLRDLYICRWRRAVLKYNLPENLIEFFVAEVRKDYAQTAFN